MYIAHLSTAVTLNQTVLNRMVYQKSTGHRVVALCPNNKWTEALKAHDIEVIDVPFIRHSASHSFTTAMLRTFLVCRRERFDVVHTHTLLPGVAGRIAARLAGVPAVVHTFHSWPLHKQRSMLFVLIYRLLEIIAAYFAHLILFQNMDDFNSWSQIPGMPRNKAKLIGNGIDCQAIQAKVQPDARQHIRREFGIPDDTTLLVKVARLELYKGHILLLEAIQRVTSASEHKIKALFVGIGKDRPQIEAEVQRLGLDDVVTFSGYRLDVPNILAAADIGLLTSRYEGIPRALMESMLLGVPVIATDVPGSRTLIRSFQNGILVKYGDAAELAGAIRTLIEDPELAQRLAKQGRQTVLQEYDEYTVAARVNSLYQRLLGLGLQPSTDWLEAEV